MAIQKVLKTYIICPAADKEKVMEKLQFWGNMEIIKVKGETVEDDFRWLSDKVHRVRFIVRFLSSYAAKESIWQKLKEGIPSLDMEKARAIEHKININGDYESLNSLDKKNKDLDVQINLSLKKIETLNMIKGINLSKSEIEFNTVSTFIVRLKKEIHEELRKEKKLHLELLCDLEIPVYAAIYHKKDTGVVEAALNKFDIKKEGLPGVLTPSEEIDELKNRISKFEKEKKNLHEEIKSKFLSNFLEYKALLDIYENKENLKVELNKTSPTDYTSLITGWIPKNLKAGLIHLIKEVSTSCHMEFYVPAGSDNPPVLLKNSRFSHPFEVVSDLYGTPEYSWIDPTPYLAPFFAFFFGLCITDAGYGIIITAVCLGAIKKFKLPQGTKKFLKLLMWGGVASIFTGILTGGWFGNILEDVRIVKNLTIMNPLENPQYFLYFSILLGFVQVLFGVFLSLFKKIKEGEVKGAFFENLPWLGILIASPLFVSNYYYFKVEAVGIISLIGVILGVIGVVGFSSYKSKNIFSRIGGGLYNLYGGTDYLKDIISYSRLFALGMGTGILAMAINEISLMTLDIPVLGYFLAVVIWTGGHIFNILMNILSGYVHSSRLQYVEFFSRFYRGGGRSFDPFIWKGKNISLKV